MLSHHAAAKVKKPVLKNRRPPATKPPSPARPPSYNRVPKNITVVHTWRRSLHQEGEGGDADPAADGEEGEGGGYRQRYHLLQQRQLHQLLQRQRGRLSAPEGALQ
jgi:hypothetical protein